MRVVTWNVWWRFGDDWRRRQRAIADVLVALRPDVVGLQESWAGHGTSQAEELAAATSLRWAFASPSFPPPPLPPESRDQDGVEMGVALLSRWPVQEVREHRLPATRREPPVALHATLAHPVGPLHVVVACLEWEPAFVDDRSAQTKALAAIVTDPGLDGPLPVLLLGDLNAAPDAREIGVLTDVMVDAWAAAGSGEGVTLASDNPHVRDSPPEHLDRRIDYVLARPGRAGDGVAVRAAFVVDVPVGGVFGSDHHPVVADVAP